MVERGGVMMRPPPHGHSPPMARNSVRFAGAGFALDQHPLARLDDGHGAGDHRGAVDEGDLQRVKLQAVRLVRRNSSMAMVGLRRIGGERLEVVERVLEGDQA